MNPTPTFACAVLLGVLCAPGLAQEASAQPAPRFPEPNVKHTVIEDDGARIEELRVRGQTQRISVTPKRGGATRYEIIPADGGRDTSDGAASGRGAAGKRVWPVLTF